MWDELTEPQQRMLREVRDAGREGKAYNGRAVRTINALSDRGLVRDDWELVPHADGKYTERHVVTATQELSS